jgi:purine-nucleoside phosphorylase
LEENMPTPHIEAQPGEIAETVLLPGDPLRAKFIAERFLEAPVQFNGVRNMLGYTGRYRGVPVSVMGSGMGMPSIAIYSWELIHAYRVKRLIRVGSCGALQPGLGLRDIVVAMSASTNSNFASQFNLPGTIAPTASWDLLSRTVAAGKSLGKTLHVGNILSSDIFYNDDREAWKRWASLGVLAVEMEAAALYLNASRAGAEALAILTVSDSLVTGQETTSAERQTGFGDMAELALEAIAGIAP